MCHIENMEQHDWLYYTKDHTKVPFLKAVQAVLIIFFGEFCRFNYQLVNFL